VDYRILKPTEFKGGLCVDPECEVRWDVSDYLIRLGRTKDSDQKTINAHGSHLVRFLNHCRDKDLEFYSVTNFDLENYRDELRLTMSASSLRLHLSTLCRFYFWAQRNGIVSNMIGYRDIEKNTTPTLLEMLPAGEDKDGDFPFKIPFLPNKRQKSGGKQYNKAVPKDSEYDHLVAHVASKHQANKRTDVPTADALNNRNMLIVRWMAEAGLREQEVINLLVSDIPKLGDSKLKALVEVFLRFGTKNNKSRKILVSPELIANTHDYIDLDRDDLLVGNDDGALFCTTSKNVNVTRLSVSFVKSLVKDGSSGCLNPHGLRRYHLTNYAIALYKMARMKAGEKGRVDEEMVKMYLTQQAGHEKFDTTLKSYLDIARRHTATDYELANLKREVERSRKLKVEMYSALLEYQIGDYG